MVEWSRGYKTKECLKLVHTYIYESFSIYVWGRYEYYITFSDSRFGYVYRKSNALDKFIEFKVESDNLLGKHIKTLQLDQGHMSNKFDFSVGARDYFLVMCTRISIAK